MYEVYIMYVCSVYYIVLCMYAVYIILCYVCMQCMYIEKGPEGNKRPGTLFPSGPFSTQPLNKASLYKRPASIYACTCSSLSCFHRVLFCTVYSSKFENDIVALSLEHDGDQCSYENRT